DFNMIRSKGYDMFGDDGDISKIDSGLPSPGFGKICCWKPAEIAAINYHHGAHHANPEAKSDFQIKMNSVSVPLCHYKWISYDYCMERLRRSEGRLSHVNRLHGWGVHYTYTEAVHRDYYENMRRNKVKVLGQKKNHFYDTINGWFDFSDIY